MGNWNRKIEFESILSGNGIKKAPTEAEALWAANHVHKFDGGEQTKNRIEIHKFKVRSITAYHLGQFVGGKNDFYLFT